MKHKAVENLIRTQFNIPENIIVKVNFLYMANSLYTFEVEWYDNGCRNQCNLSLPHISFQSEHIK